MTEDKRLEDIRHAITTYSSADKEGIRIQYIECLLSVIDEQKKEIDRLELAIWKANPIQPHEFGVH